MWNYFSKFGDKPEARCDECGMKVATASNTTDMIKVSNQCVLHYDFINDDIMLTLHLEKHHTATHRVIMDQLEQEKASAKKRRTEQPRQLSLESVVQGYSSKYLLWKQCI